MAKDKKKKYERLIDEGSLDPTVSAARGLDSMLGQLHRNRQSTEDIQGQVEGFADVSDTYGRLTKDAIEGRRTATRKRENRQLAQVQRDGLRVLMITSDRDIFEDGSESQSRFLTYAETFSELHVIVLTETYDGYSNIVKYGDRMWVYPTNSTSWLRSVFDAYDLAKAQVSFAAGFRADIIAAASPFEEGLIGYFLARKFKRTFLVEIFENPFDPYFISKDSRNGWRLWFLRFVLKKAHCVRTVENSVRNRLVAKYPFVEEKVSTFRFFYDLTYWRDSEQIFDLKERYSQFNFIFLTVAALRHDQHVDKIVEACAPVLKQYPKTGLVIVGEGRLKEALEKQVLRLDLVGKVVLETKQDVTVSHIKSADVFLNAGVRTENLDVLYKAAAGGVPVVTASGVEGGFVFIDEKSGFVCQSDDVECFKKRIGALMSNPALREQFVVEAKQRVFDLYARDKNIYFTTYRNLCEACVVKASEELRSTD